MVKKKNILISCYACSPYRGSEPGMGWNFVEHLSKYHSLDVIVEQDKWEKDINKELSNRPHLKKNLSFHFIRKRRNRWLRKIWPPSYYWYYAQWQKKAYKLALMLDREKNFDLIHQLNMVGFREPGYLWKIDKPFVWGPIGGFENIPLSLLPILGFRGGLFFLFRNIINKYHSNFLRRPKKAAKRINTKLIAATPENGDHIKKYLKSNSQILTEVGIKKLNINNIQKRESKSPIQIIWSGLHIHRKALNILLYALAYTEDVDYQLHILGEGVLTNSWKKLAIKLGVNKNCRWYGWQDLEASYSIMQNGHLFCITSVYDLTSTVILEALSFGLPVVCLNRYGFKHVITDDCGFKINSLRKNNIIKSFSENITYLYNNENIRQAMAISAKNRAKEFTWDNKIKKLNKIYDSF